MMNNSRILLIAFVLLISELAFSQVMPNSRGRQRSIGQPTQMSASYEPAMNVPLMVNEQLPDYVEALNLDAFETEIFKTILIDHYTEKEEVRNNYELKFNEKEELYIKQEQALYKELSDILTEEEVQKFKTVKFLDQRELKKKRKKEKKKRKKKSKEEKGTQ